MKLVATAPGTTETVDIAGTDGHYRVAVGDRIAEVDARFVSPTTCSLIVDGVSHVADITVDDGSYTVVIDGETYVIALEELGRHIIRTRGGGASGAGGQVVKAPMPGKVSHVAVRVGDHVDAGATLVVIEAMKMENEFKASAAGTVSEVRVTPGQAVNPGDVLVIVEPNA